MTYDENAGCNPSPDGTLLELIGRGVSRRSILRGGLVAAGSVAAGCTAELDGNSNDVAQSGESLALRPRIGFASVPPSTADEVVVPPGYSASVVYALGGPISKGPEFAPDASNTAEEQAEQAGMHHDGFGLSPDDTEAFMRKRGFEIVSDLGPAELAELYLQCSDGSLLVRPWDVMRRTPWRSSYPRACSRRRSPSPKSSSARACDS